MKDLDLERRLREAPVPDASSARERVVAASRTGVPEASTGSGRRRQGVSALVAGALIATIAITPAGSAAADWLRDVVGSDEAPAPQVVATESTQLAVGKAPSGATYRIIGGADDARCFGLVWPEQAKSFTSCAPSAGAFGDGSHVGTPHPESQTTLGVPTIFAADDVGLGAALGRDTAVVAGVSSGDVEAIRIEGVSARLLPLKSEAGDELAYFIAFVPRESAGSAQTIAYNTSGEKIASVSGGDVIGAEPREAPPGAQRARPSLRSQP